MKKTQKDWVTAQLIKKGKVSRNQALARCISRLGSYICDLRQAVYEDQERERFCLHFN